MDNKYNEIMAQRSDVELIEIVTKYHDDYQPEALLAVEAELKKRNLSVEEMASAQQELKRKEQIIAENANTRLEVSLKILTFFLPGLLNILFAWTLKADGYKRKYREAWHWTLYGVLFYIGLILVLLILERYL